MKVSSSKTAPRRRLNREDWLNAGLRILLENGIGALTVDRMADALEISRGSFYHHFKSRQDLLTAMLSEHHNPTSTVGALAEPGFSAVDKATRVSVLGPLFSQGHVVLVFEEKKLTGILTKIDFIDYVSRKLT